MRKLLRACFIVFALQACGTAKPKKGSIGVVLRRDDRSGSVRVHRVPGGHGADKAGLKAGDRLKMVAGFHVDDLDAAALQKLLRGPVGTTVEVTIVRGSQVLHLAIARTAFAARKTKASAEPKPRRRR